VGGGKAEVGKSTSTKCATLNVTEASEVNWPDRDGETGNDEDGNRMSREGGASPPVRGARFGAGWRSSLVESISDMAGKV
jgi:hypothetical protein